MPWGSSRPFHWSPMESCIPSFRPHELLPAPFSSCVSSKASCSVKKICRHMFLFSSQRVLPSLGSPKLVRCDENSLKSPSFVSVHFPACPCVLLCHLCFYITQPGGQGSLFCHIWPATWRRGQKLQVMLRTPKTILFTLENASEVTNNTCGWVGFSLVTLQSHRLLGHLSVSWFFFKCWTLTPRVISFHKKSYIELMWEFICPLTYLKTHYMAVSENHSNPRTPVMPGWISKSKIVDCSPTEEMWAWDMKELCLLCQLRCVFFLVQKMMERLF